MAAENQVLHFLAHEAGLPEGAGGCFVSGGSLGNLSALVVARDQGGRRHPELAGRRPRLAVSAEAHSSVGLGAAHLGLRPAARGDRRPPADRRGAGRGARRRPGARDGRSASSPRPGPPTPASSTTSRASAAGPRADGSGSTWTPPTAARRCSRSTRRHLFTGSATPTASSSTRTSGCSPRSTAARSSTASRRWRA